jgi:hypothetical protein
MLTLWPATLSDALRLAPVVGSTVKLTVPLPLPFAPAVMRTNGADEVAVQSQPPGAVTPTVLDPPAESNARLVGDTE